MNLSAATCMSTVTFFITYVTTCYVSHTTVVSLIHSSKISTMKVQHQLKLRQNWNVDMWVHFPGNKNIEIRELLVMEPVSLVIRLTHTRTHTRLTALCPGLPWWASTRKVKPIWILLKQETVSASGISWAICKSAPRSRQITTPAPPAQFFTGRMPFLPPNHQC